MMTEELYQLFQEHPTVCTDSRKILPDSLFFALKGEHFNANVFAEQALNEGAAFAVIDEIAFKKSERYILVPDTLKALQQLAAYHRKQLSIPVIGITGSNGKTTTKELVRDVLSQKFKVAATEGNLNNHIGVPLTLLSISRDTEIAIVEMGANHPGEIKFLCDLADPHFGLITSVGKAHLEGFGSFEGVKKTKKELYDYLERIEGTVFLNADNPHLADMATLVKKKVLYGTSSGAYVTGEYIGANPFVKLRWKTGGEEHDKSFVIQTQLIGKYNFENILGAICIGKYFGVEQERICHAIERYAPSNNRSQFVVLGSNTILLDAYNANPSSTELAIENFSEMPASRKMVILGDMKELGGDTDMEHARMVSLVKKKNFDEVIFVGENYGRHAVPSYKNFSTASEAGAWLVDHLPQHTCILLKGSRSMGLEKIYEMLCNSRVL